MNCYYKLTIPFTIACAHNTIVHVHLSLCSWENTVAAAYNLSVQVLPTIENVWEIFWEAISCFLIAGLKRFCLRIWRVVTRCIQWKLFKKKQGSSERKCIMVMIILTSNLSLATTIHIKKTKYLAYSPKCEVSWLSSFELVPSVEMLLRTVLTTVGISALVSGVSSTSSVSSLLCKSWRELVARWHFTRGG